METPLVFGNEAVELKGEVLLARPNDKVVEDWAKKNHSQPMTFSDVVVCSGTGTDLDDLESICDNLAEFEAYAWLCKVARELIDPKFLEQCCYLKGQGDPTVWPFRVFYDPGGSIGIWISRLTLDAEVIGEFVFSDDFGQTIDSPSDICCKEARKEKDDGRAV
ncbi:MAG: hypothetical protein Q8Q05_02305 [bacterium]|nr:hypothetical protein [bacterium]